MTALHKNRTTGRGRGLCSLIAAVALFGTPAPAGEEIALAAPGAAAETGRLTFGIVPQQSASRLARMWGPLMLHLSQESGAEIVFSTTKDIPTFEACLAAGAYDLAYMNPYHYAVFADAPGYEAMAHQTDKKLRGILVVRNDSPLATIDDLEDSTIAFPSPAAFGASVLPRAELTGRGIAFTPSYVKSHDSVYRAVAAGIAPAGGGVLRTFHAIPEDLRSQLRVIYRTESYTPHAIAVLPDVAPEQRARIARALETAAETAPELVASLGVTGFQVAADRDWDDVRALPISPEDAGLVQKGEVECPSG